MQQVPTNMCCYSRKKCGEGEVILFFVCAFGVTGVLDDHVRRAVLATRGCRLKKMNFIFEHVQFICMAWQNVWRRGLIVWRKYEYSCQ